MGFEPGPSKEGSWMMAQNDLVVAGIDVAKDKVDACIRSLSLRHTFPSSAKGAFATYFNVHRPVAFGVKADKARTCAIKSCPLS
jgi:hypothetical protein